MNNKSLPVFLYHSSPPTSGLIPPARVLKSRNPPLVELSIATDLPQWTSDDCIKFVQQSMKTFRSKVSDDDMDRVISNLRSNYVTGSTLMKLSDEEWRELISVMGLQVHILETFKKVIKAKEKAALSQLHRRGLPKPPAEHSEKLIMHRESHLFSAKAMFSLSVQHDVDPSIPLENGELLNKRNRSASSTVRQPAVPAGRRPLVGA